MHHEIYLIILFLDVYLRCYTLFSYINIHVTIDMIYSNSTQAYIIVEDKIYYTITLRNVI